MKQILLFTVFSLLLLSQINSQITLQSADYFPAIGDSLKTIIDNDPVGVTITPSGGNQNWIFSNLQGGFSQVRVVGDPAEGSAGDSYPAANILLQQQGGGEGYYVSDESSFAVIGFAGEDPLGQGLGVNAPFSPPYIERWAPLSFFDLNNNDSALRVAFAADDIPGDLFDGLPISPDSLRVSITSSRTDLVDGWGTLTIPGGTYDVLREKRIEQRSVRLETKIGSFPWTDITDLALSLLMIDELGDETIITYTFWSNEVEPIATVTMNEDETDVVSVAFKDNGVVTNTVDAASEEPAVFVYPNPAIIDARFEFTNIPSGNYTLSFYNLAGSLVFSDRYDINGYHLARVNVTQLPKGIYLYTVHDDEGRRLVANRLIVTKP